MRALFHDRIDAGRRLAAVIDRAEVGDAVVVGLARGGVLVAAEVARRLSLPLDALAVCKIGHPWQPEYALGAVAHGGQGVYIRSRDGLDESDLRHAIQRARTKAEALDRALHPRSRSADLDARTVLLVDDGLATGATMIAAVRWARGRGAARVVVAVPVGAAQSVRNLRREADEVVCLHALDAFGAVGFWYDDFTQVEDTAILEELHSPAPAA
jgi:putative phosphoribosyl transferase